MKSPIKVEYIGCTMDQVRWGGNDDPRDILTVGSIYTVKRREVHTQHTKIELEEFPHISFNSVCFKIPNTCPECEKAIPSRAWCEECNCCVFCCKAGDTIPTHVKIIV